jgi:hypothetical protein
MINNKNNNLKQQVFNSILNQSLLHKKQYDTVTFYNKGEIVMKIDIDRNDTFKLKESVETYNTLCKFKY